MEKWLEESDVFRAKRTVWISLALFVLGGLFVYIANNWRYDPNEEFVSAYLIFYPIIFFLMYSGIAYVEFAGKKKVVFAILAVLIPGAWTVVQVFYPEWFFGYDTLLQFLSPLLLYSFFRGVAIGDSKAILSGVIAALGMIGFTQVYDVSMLVDLLIAILGMFGLYDHFDIIYNLSAPLYFSIILITYLFSTWLLDQYLVKGKEHFKKSVDINVPVVFKDKANYVFFFVLCYTIYIVSFMGINRAFQFNNYEIVYSVEGYIRATTGCLILIPLALSTMFISKMNLAMVMSKKRQPFFIHWLLMIPIVNIVMLIVVYHQSVKEDRTEKAAVLKIDQNQKTFRGFYILLTLIVFLFSFFNDQNTDYLLFMVVHVLMLFLVMIIITFQPKWLFSLLFLLIIGDVTLTYFFTFQYINALVLAISASYSMILYRHAFYPLKKEKIEEYFQQDVGVTKDYYDTIDGNQELFDDEAI